MTFKIGNTVRFTATFKNFAGALENSSTSVIVRVYNAVSLVQFGLDIVGVTTSPSTGVYQLAYTIPTNIPSSAIIEFEGTVDGSPIVGRTKFSSRFL